MERTPALEVEIYRKTTRTRPVPRLQRNAAQSVTVKQNGCDSHKEGRKRRIGDIAPTLSVLIEVGQFVVLETYWSFH
jgi:hypothetical protein